MHVSLTGFNTERNRPNWCQVPIYERVEGHPCGYLRLSGLLRDLTDNNGTKMVILDLELEEIIDLKDPNLALVQDASTFKRDAIFMFSWLFYFIFTVVFYMLQEKFEFIDALYLRVVTLFTVGYGMLSLFCNVCGLVIE